MSKNKYYFSVFAQFDSEEESHKFFNENCLPHIAPNGGPIFSYSFEDESNYRDSQDSLIIEAEKTLELIADQIKTLPVYKAAPFAMRADLLKAALKKIKGE